MKIIIPLPPRTKKNSQQIVRAGKRLIIVPSKVYKAYEKACGPYLEPLGIDYPVNVKATYFMPTHRRVDLVNLHEALHDILVTHGVLADDNCRIIVSTDGSRVSYDKDNPRTEVEIERREDGGGKER